MNERVKEVRKNYGLTMETFGDRLGVAKSTISGIESGARNLTEQMIKAICREFNVNEHWLRTGEGEMTLTLSRRESIAAFMGELMKEEEDSFKVRLFDVLADLNEEEWQLLADLAKRLAAENQTNKSSGSPAED